MGKRISQLNALSSASLNTTLVGIDNGVTYKITLDVLEDAVINMLSASTDARLDFLETFSSSFNTFSASLDSRLDNVTIDTSSLATKTLLNTFTQSYYSDSASFDNRITSHISGTSYISESYNEFVTSYHAESSSFSSRIEAATNEQFIAGLLLTSSYSIDSASFNNRIISGSAVAGTISSSAQITALGFISTSTDLTSLNTFTQSIDSRVDSLEAATSSYITSLDGVVSSSAQILSGSGIVSGATQITAMGYAKLVGGNTFYSEQTFTNKVTFQNTLSASVIDNLNVYTASLKNAINVSGIGTASVTTIYGNLHIEGLTTTTSASNLAIANNFIYLNDSSSITNPDLGIVGNYNDGTYAHSGIFSDASDGHKWKVFKGYQPEPSQSIDINDASFQLADFQANNIYGNVYATNGVISSSTQISNYGFISTSVNLNALNTISSSYLTFTQSYYSDSSSFSSRILNITASANINTGSFVTTSSFNAFTASAQMVTTGSNSFNGTQIITGSLIITTGSFIGTQIVANTASLYLTSGSNMYVQNNGVVEITGSLRVSGSTMFASAGGDEGGEIQLAIPETNTTLQNRVTVDVWRNRLRIFEGSAGANGVYIDLSKPTGNNNEITYKASGLVNAGDFVTLDNIKATITTSGQRGLSLATISGTFICNIAGNYAGAVVGASGSSGTATITTSASTSLFGWGFTTQGDIATYIITDTTNSRAYRITIQIGGSYLNNLVSIERLH